MVCLTFPPSKDLESYLYDFVKRYHSVKENQLDVFSSYVTSKLERICSKGARGKVLSIAEIERAMVIIPIHYKQILTYNRKHLLSLLSLVNHLRRS